MERRTPDYEIFKQHRRSGWAMQWLSTLVPGKIVKLPRRRAAKPARAALYSAATRLGFTISIRNVDGTLYVCRLKKEDEDRE